MGTIKAFRDRLLKIGFNQCEVDDTQQNSLAKRGRSSDKAIFSDDENGRCTENWI